VSWSSKLQATVSLSSCEAEVVGMSMCAQEIQWLRRMLQDLFGEHCLTKTIVSADNRGAIEISKNPTHHSRVKHIAIRSAYLRECVEAGDMEFVYVPSQDLLADCLTKNLSKNKIEKLRERLCLKDIEFRGSASHQEGV
jgi:hypothetical protein